MRTVSFMLVMAAIWASSACTRRSGEIRGQVFVALSSGESLKLGAVPVLLVEAYAATNQFQANVRPWIEQRQSLKLERVQLEKQVAGTQSQLAEKQVRAQHLKNDPAVAAYLQALLAFEEWQRKPDPSSLSDKEQRGRDAYVARRKAVIERLRAAAPSWVKLEIETTAMLERQDRVRARVERISHELASLDHLRSVFAGEWLGTAAISTTDTDGAFTFTIPTNKSYQLIAFTKLRTRGEPRELYWFVPVVAHDPSRRILLNNSNLLPFD